ncbi:MAG: response regulator transcription factor [Acidobacteriota bacterium]
MKKILILEDDRTIVEGLTSALTFHEFSVISAGDGIEGYNLFEEEDPDLIILDVMLPGADGFEVCRKIRAKDPRVPIIMLTAKSQESDKLLGFELGVDDYITKPFSAKELIARIRAILKRLEPKVENKKNEVKVGSATVYFDQFLVERGNREFTLSPKEQQILKLVFDNNGKVISRDKIIDEIWGDEYYPSPKTIDNFIVKLRNKIEDNPKKPEHIITIHGAGYKFII